MRAFALLLAVAAAIAVLALAFARAVEPPPAVPTAGGAESAAAVPEPARDRALADAPPPAVPADDGLDGVVVDVAGKPVAGVEVTAVQPEAAAVVATRTDANGAFAFATVPPGPLRLLLRHAGFVLANLAVDGPRRAQRHVLRARPIVRGRVRDAGGASVARFCAVLAALGDGQLFAIATPPPGAVWLQADDGAFTLVAEAAGPHAVQVFTERGVPAQQRLDLAVDTTVECVLTIEPGVLVRGIVRDGSGQPVEGALVALRRPGIDVAAPTAADGTFALPPLAPGEHELAVDPREQPTLRRRGVQLDRAQPEPFFELQLPPGGRATGRVQPWSPGQQAAVVFVHGDGAVRRATVDAASGAFAIAELTPGSHAVFVERAEATWRSRVARQLRDAATAPRVEVTAGGSATVEVEDPVATMARVRGRVVGRAQPEQLVVRAFAEDRALPERVTGLFRATPLADGSFELDGLPAGRWRLQAMAGADVVGWATVELAANADVEFVLPADRR